MTLDFLNHNSYKTHILYYHISLDIMRHRGGPEWSQDGPKMLEMAQDVPKMAHIFISQRSTEVNFDLRRWKDCSQSEWSTWTPALSPPSPYGVTIAVPETTPKGLRRWTLIYGGDTYTYNTFVFFLFLGEGTDTASSKFDASSQSHTAFLALQLMSNHATVEKYA